MKILAIESSCDETSAAVIEDGTKIISNVISSSKDLHEKTGGIIPEIAAREQVKCIIPVIQEALNKLDLEEGLSNDRKYLNLINKHIDSLAITIGPGLIGSLLVGIETAKTIAFVTGKPIIPVNHIFAHIYANFLLEQIPQFPALALVVSGGHTELFLLNSHQQIKWLGGTLDDAAGECFDKTARILGLGFPGGPAIATEAEEFRKQSTHTLQLTTHNKIRLPRPMIDDESFNFSFSGLKTAVLREVKNLQTTQQLNNGAMEQLKHKSNYPLNKLTIQQLSYEIEESITDVLVDKTLRAAQKYCVKSILVGGGVAANRRLTEKFNQQSAINNQQFKLYVPPPLLCTDNAAYIGSFAYFHNSPVPWQEIKAVPDLEVEV